MKKRVKFIYFDIGKVIHHYQPSLDMLCFLSGKPRSQTLEIFEKYNASCNGKILSTELWDSLKKDLEFTHEAPDYASFWSEYLDPIEETHELIYDLAKTYPLGILSNIEHGVFDQALSKGSIPKISWASVVESCRVGLMKPDLQIFHHAQKMARVNHEEILFIDDREENIIAARSLGWQTVHFDPAKVKTSINKIKKIVD